LIRILIVDDHRLFADALKSSLKSPAIEDVDIATTAAEGLEAAFSTRPDVMLVDLALPDANGVQLGRSVLERLPDLSLIALTALEDPTSISEAMHAGFCAYVSKVTPLAELVSIIHSVLNGQIVFPREAWLPSDARPRLPASTAELLVQHLTAREKDILSLLVGGLTGPEIALKLSISRNTVRTHVQRILTKLGVHSRLEAVAFAVKHQVVDVPTARPRVTTS